MKWGQYGSQHGWEYWRGAQQYKWGKDKKDKKDKGAGGGQPDQQTLLAPYDKVRVNEQDAKAAEAAFAASVGMDGPTPDTLLKDLQSCVNGARKAEARVKKLRQDRQQRLLQWKTYQREVKAEFLKQHARHQQNLEQIEADLVKALAGQDEARSRVRAAALSAGQDADVVELPPAVEAEDPWVSFLGEEDASMADEDEALRAVLARAMSGGGDASAVVPCLLRRPPGRSPAHRMSGSRMPRVRAKAHAWCRFRHPSVHRSRRKSLP